MRRVTAALALCAVVVLGAPVWAQERKPIHLPTQADAIAYAAGAESILNPKRALETVLPGPASDEEAITVGFDTTGRAIRVSAVQRLVIDGLGDFRFKVPGPARRLDPLPGSDNVPGLRRGAILWQGFSSGTKELAARVELFPDLERPRLPIEVSLSLRAGGRPMEPEQRASGPLRLELRIRNVSALPVGLPDATAEPEDVAPVLDAIARDLAAGRRPVPGGDLPAAIPGVERSPAVATRDIEAAFEVRGSVVFDARQVRGLEARGGTVTRRGDEVRVEFEAQLGGGAPLEKVVTVTGVARRAELPRMDVRAVTTTPLPKVAAPPAGRTWASFVRSTDGVDGEDMLRRALVTLWQVARERQYDAYLGNPDPTGPADTSYRFVLVRTLPPEPRGTLASAAGGVTPLGAVLFGLLVAGLLGAGVVAWSRA